MNAEAQSAALQLLISAIPLQNNTDSIDTRPTGPESTQARGTPPNSDGGSTYIEAIIIGGSIGGILILTCSGIGIWWLLCHRRQQKTIDTPGAHKDHQPHPNGATLNYLVVSPSTEQSKNRGEHVRSRGARTGGLHQDFKHEIGNAVAPISRPGPSSSHRSNSTSNTSRGSSVINELVADLRALGLQHSRLQERIWEEDESLPPEYSSVRSAL
ncbi:hypothetical protein PQX77_018855 [Marasmius sp. AFHP31]|nr:hypothetical protein PQX77_018855 [Marasmius sp. AFHP31]